MKKYIIIIAAAIVLTLGAFYLFGDDTQQEPPQQEPIENGRETEAPADNDADNAEISVQLYYYDAALDQGPGGAQCTREGLVAVERSIPQTTTPLRDTLELLLGGELTTQEEERGLTTEFPLTGVTFESVSIEDGVAILAFNDPQHATSGGACRSGILWGQIEETAKQFPSVRSARFMPEELFQP